MTEHIMAEYAAANLRGVNRRSFFHRLAAATLGMALSTPLAGLMDTRSPDEMRCGIIESGAWWDAVLTAEEIRLLAQGADPRTIRPDRLLYYSPLEFKEGWIRRYKYRRGSPHGGATEE